jgi:hypothetical protein
MEDREAVAAVPVEVERVVSYLFQDLFFVSLKKWCNMKNG